MITQIDLLTGGIILHTVLICSDAILSNEGCPFEMTDDIIKLNDWNGTYYKIDLNGNLLTMIRR